MSCPTQYRSFREQPFNAMRTHNYKTKSLNFMTMMPNKLYLAFSTENWHMLAPELQNVRINFGFLCRSFCFHNFRKKISRKTSWCNVSQTSEIKTINKQTKQVSKTWISITHQHQMPLMRCAKYSEKKNVFSKHSKQRWHEQSHTDKTDKENCISRLLAYMTIQISL